MVERKDNRWVRRKLTEGSFVAKVSARDESTCVFLSIAASEVSH